MYILDELNAQNDYFSINLKCQLSLIAVNLIFFVFFFTFFTLISLSSFYHPSIYFFIFFIPAFHHNSLCFIHQSLLWELATAISLMGSAVHRGTEEPQQNLPLTAKEAFVHLLVCVHATVFMKEYGFTARS